MGELEDNIAFIVANRKLLPWYERLLLPLVVRLARFCEPYRQRRRGDR
jgi:hypothetical protein